jgi:hypothetical protein
MERKDFLRNKSHQQQWRPVRASARYGQMQWAALARREQYSLGYNVYIAQNQVLGNKSLTCKAKYQ